MVATPGTAEIVLSAYRPRDDVEAADFDRLAAILRHCADPWSREIPMHLATSTPQSIRPENPDARLRWLSLPDATEATSEANLRESLARLAQRLAVVNPQAR
jgi:hypothetical protein